MLASRFPLVYLFHRYALAAAIRVVGSAEAPLSLAGDGQTPVVPWSAAKKAGNPSGATSAGSGKTRGSRQFWKQLAPVENSNADPERFTSTAGYLLSPQDGARAVADTVVGGLLDAHVCNECGAVARRPATAVAKFCDFGNGGLRIWTKHKQRRFLPNGSRHEIAERLMMLAAN